MKKIVLIIFLSLFAELQSLTAAESLKNGDFETGDATGWKYWETYPWDGDGAPVEYPTHITIAVPGTIGNPFPPTISGSFALTQQVSSNGTARGGLFQEVRVIPSTPYILTGNMSFYGDDIGDVTIIGILDGSWNPALAFTTINKNYISGNAVSTWMEFSITVVPSKDIITVFTETRQDWTHGNVAGWYDNFSLRPITEPTRFLVSHNSRNSLPNESKQDLEQDTVHTETEILKPETKGF